MYHKELEYDPNFKDAVFNAGLAFLKLGDNSKGINYLINHELFEK